MSETVTANETMQPGSPADIRGVLLPLHESYLLLPNVTVTEVIGYRDEDPIENSPPWLRGSVIWRQSKVPVISFEYFVNKEAAEPGYRSRIALCHNLFANPKMPYIGLLCKSIPRLARVNSDTVTESMMQELLPEMTLKHISYNGEDAWIPDLEELGEQSSKLLFPG